jgi:hypothetical protein
MSSLVAHALYIESDDGTGNPVNYTNTTLGFQSGYGYLITGRPGLDGGKTITGDTTRTTWYEGILAKDFASFAPSRNADLIEGGSVSSNSSLSWSIVEKNSFRSTLQSNGIYLNRCRVTYFYVTSADGATYNFNKVWTGVIDDLPYSEVANRSNAIDNSKDIFGSLPPRAVDTGSFPNANPESLNKCVPIVLGRVAYSELINVSQQKDRIQLGIDTNDFDAPLYVVAGQGYEVLGWQAGHAYAVGDRVLPVATDGVTGISHASGYIYTATVAGTSGGTEPAFPNASGETITDGGVTWVASSSRALELMCTGVLFSANDSRLVGSFVSVVYGSTKQSRKILSNEASDPTTNRVKVLLEFAFDGTPGDWDISDITNDIWYYDVRAFSSNLIASSRPISEFKENLIGNSAIYIFDTDSKSYSDVSEVNTEESLSNISALGYPGIRVEAKSVDLDGNLNVYFKIPPSDYHNTIGSGTLIDGDDSTYTDLVFTTPDDSTSVTLKLNNGLLSKSYDDIYLLFDFSHKFASSAVSPDLKVTVRLRDIHSRSNIATGVNFEMIQNFPVGTTFTDKYLLPRSYFGETGDDTNFYAFKDRMNLGDILQSTKDTLWCKYLNVEFQVNMDPSSNNYTLRLREIGFVGKKSVNITTESLYGTLIGETFGSEWQDPDDPGTGRRTATDAIETIGDGLEHLVRNYDYNHPKWQASYAYKVGEKVRSIDDNGFIYICTVAGTSGASEPTFPTTLTSTVADNTITWKALDTLKIHCGSFDALAIQRAEWFIGRTLTEKKPSIEWYRELARHGWFLIINDYQGRVKVKAWRENTTALTTFDSSNILTGSLSEVKPSSLRKCYNDFLIRYDWNPASQSYNKQLGITKTDEPEFPGESETLSPGDAFSFTSIIRETSVFDGYDYQFLIHVGAVHGLSNGGFISLTGNADGFDFGTREILALPDVDKIYVGGHFTSAVGTFTGTLRSHTDSRLKWKTFAPGINSYALGKVLWDQARAGYVVTKTVNKLPQELGDCPWFIDPEATDPSGNRIWPELTGSDDHPAVYYLQNWVEWSPLPKPQLTLETSHAEARVTVASEGVTRYLEEGDPIALNEAKLTGGVARDAWVHEVTFVPGDEKRPDRVRLGLTLESEDFVSLLNIIDENGAAAGDIIDENSAAAGDIIDENGA